MEQVPKFGGPGRSFELHQGIGLQVVPVVVVVQSSAKGLASGAVAGQLP